MQSWLVNQKKKVSGSAAFCISAPDQTFFVTYNLNRQYNDIEVSLLILVLLKSVAFAIRRSSRFKNTSSKIK